MNFCPKAETGMHETTPTDDQTYGSPNRIRCVLCHASWRWDGSRFVEEAS